MTLPRLGVAIVDAFTRDAGHGNRAGIVLDAEGLDADRMVAIARAVAASETAFVTPGRNGADFSFRYFTPSSEIEFCGHDTVATFHYLVEIGRIVALGRYRLDCPAGRVEVEVEPVDDHVRVWMATPRHPWQESPIPASKLLPLLGARPEALDPGMPVMRTGPKMFLPFARKADLRSLAPRWDDLAAAGMEHGVNGFFVFTREAEDPEHVVQGRFFAPALGVQEDPVTGSANGPLAEYLAMQGVLALPPGGGTARGRAEQGNAMGKPGRVDLEVTGRPGAIERVRVGGVAVTVVEGALHASAAPAAVRSGV
jgi:PhzF family phenazine biosynthesis protein